MKKFVRVLALVLTFTLLFATCAYSAPAFYFPQQEKVNQLDYEPGQLIVKFKDNINTQNKKAKIKELGLYQVKNLGEADTELLVINKGNMENILNRLRECKDVEYAVPNYHFRPAGGFHEPLFSRQWGLQNTGQKIVDPLTATLVSGTKDVDINAPEAWKSVKSSREVLVGVLDTGVDITHPDLRDKIWINPGEIPGDGIDNDGNGYVDDIHGWNFADNSNQVFDYTNPFADGHGTGIAGIIAASSNNNFGIAGVAPNAKIVCLKFINSEGVGLLSDAIAALNYARQQKIDVINASWGAYFPTKSCDPQFYQTELKPLGKAIKDSKALFIAAAGNDGYDLDVLEKNAGFQYFPAAFNYPNIISVTAVDNKGLLCTAAHHGWASNTGAKTVDLAAPGNNILSTITVGDFFGAAVEGKQGKARTAVWGFGLQDISQFDDRVSLVSRELNFLLPQWNCKGKKNAKILLVDDDNSKVPYMDCSKYWTAVLKKLGIKYDEYLVSSKGKDGGSSLGKTMKKYDLVIWQTGRSDEKTPLTAEEVSDITAYIKQGGSFLLSGENAISGNEAWAAEVLQAQLIMEGLPCYDLTGLPGSTYQGFQCISDGYEMGSPPVFHDLYCPTNPETSWSGLTFKYSYISGTSIAAPHVTGTAALILGKKPNQSPAAVRQIILKSTRPLPQLKGKVLSGGMVDAYAALHNKHNKGGKQKNK
ncbi:MAG: S8 family serine peptidase [Thermacetogeniaceae bacterium]|jgi:subtilisin family serine protease